MCVYVCVCVCVCLFATVLQQALANLIRRVEYLEMEGTNSQKSKKKNGINKRIEFLEMEGTNSQKSKKIKIKIKQWNK